ncbi:hypothetical protein EW146_g3337 [Bondarzewia mesenterica]|uniref:Amidohydrolase 3 domain-containing protein n=1 Tax=Bondarzewia mesenterica TaxID=1095465 RepID=A0A4S4LXU6_9AGAM|nr:hypothetical protein EW146_g3337 [Bondarzewia mesenterica]
MEKFQVQQRHDASTSQSRRQWLVVIALSVAVLLKYLGPSITKTADLPHAYALCSPSTGIYTVDSNNSKTECVIVVGDTVFATGSEGHVRSIWDAGNPSEDLKTFYTTPGSIVVPGLSDAHAHVLEWGFKQQLPLEDCRSVDVGKDVIAKIKQYILTHPDVQNDSSRWIQGMGWDQTKWPIARFPTADDFDRDPLLRDRPIALSRIDVHASWVSHRVIEQMGKLPEEVYGGIIVRDDQGNPTEPSSVKWTEEEMLGYFETAMHDALSVGLTSIHDAASSPEVIQFFKRRADERTLPVRLYLMGNAQSDTYWGAQIPRLVNYGIDGRLNVRSIKLFTDVSCSTTATPGALGSWGAALLAPYSDNPDTNGLMRSSQDVLRDLVENFFRDGWQVNIHCIGDRANKVALDILQDVMKKFTVDVEKWRPRIEHAQIMQLSDLERIGSLGVIPSVQPTHATSDMWYAESRLGPDRIKGAYAYQTLLQTSRRHILPLGSDFPVEGINPLLGFYAAVSRLSVNGDSPNGTSGWYPAEALTRTQALRGMTCDAAYAAFAETERGMLIPGMKADYVVLNRDIVSEEVPVGDILNTKVLATAVDGRVVYGSI